MAMVYYTKTLSRDALLEKVFMAHYGYLPTLYKDKNGKPYLEKDYISISHSHEYVVVAIGDFPIGIDIQKIEYKEKVVSLFSEEVHNAKVFTRLWALKESYGKYLGIGLNKEVLKKDYSEYVLSEMFVCDGLLYYIKEIEDFVCAICTNDDTIHYVCIGG